MMASSSNVFWNVEPAPLMAPLSFGPAAAVVSDVLEEDPPQAARPMAQARPAAMSGVRAGGMAVNVRSLDGGFPPLR